MRKLLAIAAAGGALAFAVPAALATTDDAAGDTPATTLQPVQTAEPDRDDCPEKDGSGGAGNGGGYGSSATTTPGAEL